MEKLDNETLYTRECQEAVSHVPVSRDPEDDPMYRRKHKLLFDCKQSLGNPSSSKRALNIAVIGPPGHGKSTFLNTVFASLNNDKWHEHALSGNFGGSDQQTTKRLKSFSKADYYRSNDNILMPNFIDMMGFENVDNYLNRKLLKIILSGKVKENEQLLDVVKYLKRQPRLLSYFKYDCRPVWKRVDRIIVVCSGSTFTLPEELIKAVVGVASELDIPLYGVLTHADTPDKKTTTTNFMAYTKQEKDKKFKELIGAPGHRFKRIANYCDEVDPSGLFQETVIPSLDVPVLELMNQIFNKRKGDDEEDPGPYDDLLNKMRLPVFGFFGIIFLDLSFTIVHAIGIIEFLVMVVIIAIPACYFRWFHWNN